MVGKIRIAIATRDIKRLSILFSAAIHKEDGMDSNSTSKRLEG